MQNLKLGSKGPEVESLQYALVALGFSLGQVDGVFGTRTEFAVKSFQVARNILADGVAGHDTLEELGIRLDAPPPAPVIIKPIGLEPRPMTAKNITVAPQGNTLLGIDISHHQPTVDWKKVAQKIKFVSLKATEGSTNRDWKYYDHRKGAKDQGLPTGAYHFFRSKEGIQTQTKNFLSVVEKLVPNDMVPSFDLEDRSGPKGKVLLDRCLQWLDIVSNELGVLPMVYLSTSYITDMFVNAGCDPSPLFKYPLWLANYGVNTPHVPPPWHTWDFWQSSEHGKVEGIKADGVDIDYFNGTEEELKRFIIK